MSDKNTKHENFKRMADLRARKIANDLRVLSNLASYNYEFHPEEVDTLFDFIQEQTAKSRSKFETRLIKASERANKEASKALGVPLTKPSDNRVDGGPDDEEENEDYERYPLVGVDDLGEDATPESPQTGLPGPSEADIEQDGAELPNEQPWGDDEAPGQEMELADAAPGRRTVHRKK